MFSLFKVIIKPAPQKIVEKIIQKPRVPPPRIVDRIVNEPAPATIYRTKFQIFFFCLS